MRVPLFFAAAAFCSASLAAHADTFTFSFGTASSAFSGSGTLTASLVSPGDYLITAVSGTTDTGNGANRPIAGILAPGTFPTLANGGTIFPNDNLLFVTGGAGTFDTNGLSYSLTNGAQINLYNEGASFNDALLERSNTNTVFENVPISVTAVTPEPSSFVLLGTGLLGAVGAMRRRLA